jgi:AcrR family transcriptional regulator
MADVPQDLEAAAAELIARLPDDWREMRLPEMETRAELSQSIFDAMNESLDILDAVFDQLRPRVTSPDQTLGEVATEAEAAMFDGALRVNLSAERARAALEGWDERSGYNAYLRSQGVELNHPVEPSTVEAPDGTLTLMVSPLEGGF